MRARERDDGGRTLAELLAEQIEDEIIDQGWPVGTVMGSEAELLEKYGVSRAIFREAIRIVDHHGVAEMRRGPGGGLVVATPDLDAVVRTVTLQLHFHRIDPDHVSETRRALELRTVQLAAERLAPEGEELLRQHLAEEQERIRARSEGPRARYQPATLDFHLVLAELTGNPAMRLFVQIAAGVQTRQSPGPDQIDEFAAEVNHAHRRIAEAVFDGDVETAQRRMARHLDSVLTFIDPSAEHRKPPARSTASPS